MEKIINGYHLYIENKKHDDMILWIMGEHEKQYFDFMQKQLPCSLVAFQCQNWNHDLSPWQAQAVFKNQDFSGQGKHTFEIIVKEIVPWLQLHFHFQRLYIVGYSLAGLFSLFTMVKSELFAGAGSCSGSLWYDGFETFVYQHPCHARRIYMSLGQQEHKTRHPAMSQVKTKTEAIHCFFKNTNDCCFKYEPGNHFHHPERRLLHAMQWLIQEGESQ